MLHPSRRDQLALEPLLRFIDREITADPEQRNPARRAARRQEVAQATLYFKNLRAEEEERKDRELRARLDGVAIPAHIPSHRAKYLVAPLSARADADTSVHPNRSEERFRTPTHRTPHTRITNADSIDATSAGFLVKQSSLSTTTGPTTAGRPSTAATASDGNLTSNDRRTSDVRKPKILTSASRSPLVVASGPNEAGSPASSSPNTVVMSAAASISRADLWSDAASFVKPTESHSQHPSQSSRALKSGTVITDSVTSTTLAVTDDQRHLYSHSRASIPAAEINARVCSVSQHRGRTPICGLLHRRDFDVERISERVIVDGKVGFAVQWKSFWVAVKLIVNDTNVDYPHVDADGTRWYIKGTSGRRERNGIEEVKVQWEDTSEPLEMLNNVQGAIDAFEADERLAGPDEIAKVRQRRILTFQESQFPRGSVLPQNEEDYAASQRWVSWLWPKICPHRTLDLYPAIYRIHMEIASRRRKKRHGGKSYRCLMKLPQLRPLRWSQDFLESGTLLKCCSRRRASLFIQVTGVQVAQHCTRCSHHNNAPFLGCVRTARDQRLWLNGACANCGMQRNDGCDYHGASDGCTRASSDSARFTIPSHTTNTGPRRDSAVRTTVDHAADDSSDTSDDDRDDEDEDDDDDVDVNYNGNPSRGGWAAEPETEASGNRHWPLFPRNRSVKDIVLDGALAASSSGGTSNTSSSYSFGGLSLSSSVQSESRSKLPSATKTRQSLSRDPFGQSFSLSALHQRARARDEGNGNSSPRNIDAEDTLQVQPESSASQQNTGDNYTPQPIELDLLKLAFKYDHLKPLKQRNPKSGVSALASTTINSEPGRADTPVHQTAQHMSAQNKRTLYFSPGPPSPVSKKRPAGMPPLHRRRPPQRQALMEPGHPADPTSILLSTAPIARPSLIPPRSTDRIDISSAKTFLQIRALDNIERDDVHAGCQKGQPCRNYQHEAPVPRDPDAKVYRETLLDGRQISVEQAEHIVSRANCFWARRFTVLWRNWCDDLGGIENEQRSQVEWLLSYPESLRKAAKECCPKLPKVRQFAKDPKDVISIDD